MNEPGSMWRRCRAAVAMAVPVAALVGAGATTSMAAVGGNGNGYGLANNTPTWVSQAQNLGSADGSQTIQIAVWLTLQNEPQLTQQAQAVTTPGNSSYHKFLSPAQVQATYDPTNNQVNAVENYLQAKGLTVLNVADNNYYINAQGTIAQISQAFHVSVNNYSYNGHTYRSNSGNPQVDSSMNGNIAAITGIDDASYYQPDIVPTSSVDGPNQQAEWPELCGGPSYSTTIPVQSGKKPTKTTLSGFVPCGYGAHQIANAYGIDKLCTATSSGYSGTCGQGQTIVITDAYGSPTLQQDVNAYDSANNLPALTVGQNLLVDTPNGIVNKPENKRQDPVGWQAEVTLDVENAHAIAPGATIELIASPNNYADLDEAINWAVVHHLGNIVSNSWGEVEALLNPAQVTRDERILQTAALEGIGVNFSSGDSADYAQDGFHSTEYPTSSPWVTSIGGTSLFLTQNGSYGGESGWGTTETRDYNCVSPASGYYTSPQTCSLYAPAPLNYGFIFGAGGGLSQDFQAQPWQTGIPSTLNGWGATGTARAVPDISMLADPETGSTIYITDESEGATSPIPETYGGTSLACPLFSAVMALVDQERAAAGKGPAGLAAQYLYNLPSGALHDINGTPYNSLYYGSAYTGRIFSMGFGQDEDLATAPGWDDVTGVGTPNGAAFISAVASQ